MASLISLAPAFIVLALIAGIVLWVASSSKRHPETVIDENVWAQAMSAETSTLGRVLLGAAKPLSRIPPVYEAGASRQYAALANLVGSSGMFNGSLEVFLSVQSLTGIIGLVAIALTWAFQPSGLMLLAAVGVSLIVGMYPLIKVRERANRRAQEISDNLPDFAEVLLMSLSAGESIMQALRFTSSSPDIPGPVTTEVRNMLALLDMHKMTDKELFDLAGHRLGTPEAVAFFNALAKAHLEGSRVVESIQAQANALRISQFQKARARSKKLPTKLTLITFTHLVLSIMILTMIPFLVTIGTIGQ